MSDDLLDVDVLPSDDIDYEQLIINDHNPYAHAQQIDATSTMPTAMQTTEHDDPYDGDINSQADYAFTAFLDEELPAQPPSPSPSPLPSPSHPSTVTLKRPPPPSPVAASPTSSPDRQREKRPRVERAPVHVYRRAPIAGDYLSVTDAHGNRLFVTVHTPQSMIERSRIRVPMNALVSAPIRQIMAQVDEAERNAAIQRSLDATTAHNAPPSKSTQLKRPATASASASNSKHSNELWVNKYGPRLFRELISPERINREVLSWLKQWDAIVFAETNEVTAAKHNNRNGKQQNSHNGRSRGNIDKLETRPSPRVLLLSGMAGTGKTTLAHIVARHCGYTPFEINASDERTETVLTDRIRAACEMKSVNDRRPNCIILDEIDGVDGSGGGGDGGEGRGAINAVIKIVMAGNNAHRPKNERASAEAAEGNNDSDDERETEAAPAAAANTKAKRATIPPLRRPIICVCNDPYVPALRPLRAIAKIVHFDRPNRETLIDRLTTILTDEQMNVEHRVLHALCDRVTYDIRGALNTLQFIQSNHQRLTMSVLNGLSVGERDTTKSRFDMVEQLITGKASKSEAATAPPVSTAKNPKLSPSSASRSKLNSLFVTLSDADTCNHAITDTYHNLAMLDYTDPTMNNAVSCMEWMSYYDSVSTFSEDSHYTPIVAFALQSSLPAQRNQRLPRLQLADSYQHYKEEQYRRHLLNDWLTNEHNRFSLTHALSVRSLTVDVLTHLLHIVTPNIKATNPAMFSQIERSALQDVIAVMLQSALTYEPIDLHQNVNAMEYLLAPPIDLLAQFRHQQQDNAQQKQVMKFNGGRYKGNETANTNTAATLYDRTVVSVIDRSFPLIIRQWLCSQLIHERLKLNQIKRDAVAATDTATTTVDKNMLDVTTEKKSSASAAEPVSLSAAIDSSSAVQAVKMNGGATKRVSSFLDQHAARLRAKARSTTATAVKTDTTIGVAPNSVAPSRVENIIHYPLLHVKFHEGVTVAVRRPVNVRFFM